MWNISKTVFVERNGRKFSTQSTIVHIGRVLLMPDSLSMVWGHLVHFAKFPILRFSKGYSLNRFHQISTKLHTKDHNQGLIQAVTFFSDLPKIKKYGTLKFLSTQSHMGLEISKRYSSYSFHTKSAKLNEDIGYHGGIQLQAITFLGNRTRFKNFVAL